MKAKFLDFTRYPCLTADQKLYFFIQIVQCTYFVHKCSCFVAGLGNLLKMNRLNKLSSIFTAVKQDNKFLQPGDVVVVEGALFGSIRTEIIR